MSTIGMRKTALGAIGLAVTATLTLSGCKNGNEEVAPPAAPSAPSSSSASSGGYADPSQSAQPSTPASPSDPSGYGDAPAGGAGAGGTAKPGQTFKIGETANVPFSYGSTKGTIALTVTAIEQGNPADLDSLKLGDQVKGKVPYYIRYTVKNTGSTDLAYSTVGHMKGLLGDGTEAQGVSIIGKFEKCPNESLPKGFTNGKTATACAIALAPSAQTKVGSAEYWGDPYNNLSNGKGLIWK
ncbi:MULTISPECIES: hypothetical protein [unclassified Streptomyces]|uniref:hypothetical protein n=1 Tax=unclassified Streptomyces TaxID=2593676 RepID=UPI001BE901F5|nr:MULTISPECIES: hypothetical protein [unclassified Streptomyces]MBT2407463.1 hypothetical protein [Streptomyces sp. ISL-21]MBT2612651.1 hypothetical protein [Streptomyces sp. ISL-87]